MTDTPKVRPPPTPLTLFDHLKDATLTFSYDEGENTILIIAAGDKAKTLKYKLTTPTVTRLRRWLRSVNMRAV
jgi:hypothetical protein